jgi:hypothetical protein
MKIRIENGRCTFLAERRVLGSQLLTKEATEPVQVRGSIPERAEPWDDG